MLAYNTVWLNNLFIQEQAAGAFHQTCLKKDELNGINRHFTAGFYTPNFFIRIGLFILTTVILLFSFGLFSLVFLGSIEHAVGGIAIFFGLLSYAALEYIVQSKNHFKSGVDDALTWISAISFAGGISYLFNAGALANCWIIFIICVYYSVRFADRAISIAGYIALLGIFFFAILPWGVAAKAVLPFVLMAVSFGCFFITKRMQGLTKNMLYQNCLQTLSVSALATVYLSANYYVVREAGNALFNFEIADEQPLPFGWIFWILTLIIPLVYIARGIQKKDRLLIRLGLLLVAVIVFTVRYYYAFAAVEMIMAVGGIILIAVSYALSRYLRTPKHGFTNFDINPLAENGKMQLESIILAQSLSIQATPESKGFGGGSFGGGGASGDF
ncbi:MAG: hypothetical protein JWP81_757 [Ferruginibacter sp.]|nr:hypothetical protein [Ferruginibacter sp.]